MFKLNSLFFSANNTKIQCQVKGWRTITITNGTLTVNGFLRKCLLTYNIPTRTYPANNITTITTIPEIRDTYTPIQRARQSMYYGDMSALLDMDGTLSIHTYSARSNSTLTVYLEYNY